MNSNDRGDARDAVDDGGGASVFHHPQHSGGVRLLVQDTPKSGGDAGNVAGVAGVGEAQQRRRAAAAAPPPQSQPQRKPHSVAGSRRIFTLIKKNWIAIKSDWKWGNGKQLKAVIWIWTIIDDFLVQFLVIFIKLDHFRSIINHNFAFLIEFGRLFIIFGSIFGHVHQIGSFSVDY